MKTSFISNILNSQPILIKFALKLFVCKSLSFQTHLLLDLRFPLRRLLCICDNYQNLICWPVYKFHTKMCDNISHNVEQGPFKHEQTKALISLHITLFIQDTGKQVIWQTVKNQMKCRIRRYFIRVCTVC